jgi:hypothetical protein
MVRPHTSLQLFKMQIYDFAEIDKMTVGDLENCAQAKRIDSFNTIDIQQVRQAIA